MDEYSFVITTDTCCDLPKSYLEENGVDLVTLYYNMNGVAYGNGKSRAARSTSVYY